MLWHNAAPQDVGGTAEQIVAWVNANGGEARYESQGAPSGADRIAVRTINGWAYAAPGHYVVMGSATFTVCAHNQPATCNEYRTLRDFYPCDPETFERRWEPKS